MPLGEDSRRLNRISVIKRNKCRVYPIITNQLYAFISH